MARDAKQQEPVPEPVKGTPMGQFDGRLTCAFECGNGFNTAFEFDLPNIVGVVGPSHMTKEKFEGVIQKALVSMLGMSGVVKK
jgi:hypothetical protein